MCTVQNGVSYNMLKIRSKRRRPREEILQARVAEEEKEAEYQKKLSELKSFEN